MGTPRDDVNVNVVDQARRIVLDMVREVDILIEEEGREGGTDTERYKRLSKKRASLKYIDGLILDDLRSIFN